MIQKDKIVVITGAGSGLGRELAITFCDEGYTVMGLGRNIDTLKETGTLINSSNYQPFVADVSNFEQVKNVCTDIIIKYHRIDILFNNAAIYPKVNFLEETAYDWENAVSINLNGVANCCKVIVPIMIEQHFGRIYNLGSWADISPIANSAVYSCTKGGIHSLTKAISVDIAHLNLDIEIHEWNPGHLNTQMSDYTGTAPSQAARWGLQIVRRTNSSKNCIFTQNIEWLPPKSLKQKIKSKLYFWK